MKKIFLMALILAVLLLAFLGCESEDSGTENLSDSFIYIWIDEETGVHYVIFQGFRKGGITPRLNADGTLYVGNDEGGGE